MVKEKKPNMLKASEEKTLIESISANNKLQGHLKLALKNTSILTSVIMPKIANSLKDYINEFKAKIKDNTKLDDSKKLIQRKALTEHCYDLVEYNRKNGVNHAFEMVVSRSIKLALMLVDYPSEFNVDTKDNKVFIMDKIATPMIEHKKEGQKAGVKKVANTSTELVEVHTGVVDKVYAKKYPVKKRGGKSKVKVNLMKQAVEFFDTLKIVENKANKKDVEFFDYIDNDEIFAKLENIKNFLNSKSYQNIRAFSVEYQQAFDGSLEKKSA
tara:strand:- start:87 stop:896 length:810 start_codon:yes stop_codon:yes gene_type:complete